MEGGEVVGRLQEKKAAENIRGDGRKRMKMKGGLMRPSRTTRDSSSHVKPGHINRGFWHSCDQVRGTESPRHRSLHAYLSLSAA